jgi:hypothetical protein
MALLCRLIFNVLVRSPKRRQLVVFCPFLGGDVTESMRRVTTLSENRQDGIINGQM